MAITKKSYILIWLPSIPIGLAHLNNLAIGRRKTMEQLFLAMQDVEHVWSRMD